MADLSPLEQAILGTLAVQSDGYLCGVASSAFISIGLFDPEETQQALVGLEDKGLAEFFIDQEHLTLIKVERDAAGEPIVNGEGGFNLVIDEETGEPVTEVVTQDVDSGWIITEAGKAALNA